MNFMSSLPTVVTEMGMGFAASSGGNSMFEMTNENFARLLKGLTIAVGNRRNRILIYQFLAAEIRALHYSYGVGDGESYKRALTFLEECERLTLRSLVRKSAERHVEVTADHAKRVFLRALKKLNAPPELAADLEASVFAIPPRK
jgi:ribosomal protein S12 methylthiotransferase accessory factor YcaO